MIDKRSIENWFNILWKFEILLQPEPKVYALNVAKVSELEISLPPKIDPKQRRLF